MAVLLIVLLLILLLGGFGFVAHLLWIFAVIVLVIWLVGFLMRGTNSVSGTRNRWYRW